MAQGEATGTPLDWGRKAGMVWLPGEARPVAKDGEPAAALGCVTSQWIDVGPALAKRWLENNFRNRPLCEDVVQAYARDMVRGVWVATHQGVAFNSNDELIDGQHRLHAIVLCGKTVRMMVTFGLPAKIAGSEMTTMDAVDRGRPRSVADQLRIQHGLKDGGVIAAVCAMLGGLCFGERTRRLSVGQTLDIYREYEQGVNLVIGSRAKGHGLRQAGVLAGFAFALATVGPGKVAETLIGRHYIALVTGEGLRAGSALTHLRAFLLSDEAKLLSRGTDRGVAELVLHAIYLEAKGKKVAKLEQGTEGWAYFRDLQKMRVEKVAAIFRLPEAK